ncbi:hypothetical protein U3516DRAFT_842475 [Neocallimastix sp. 'constans']
MNIEKENNTELFFKELRSKTLDISLMYKQYFKIYNDRQYDRLIEKFERYESKNNTYNKNEYRQLVIINEYIIKKLVNDNNNSYILTLLNEYSHISLYCLLKYNYISYKIFDYFKCNEIFYSNFIFITFYIAYYLKRKYINLKNIIKYIGYIGVSSYLKNKYGEDIKALEYILINICKKT